MDFVDWKDTSGRNVKIFTGNMPQHVTSCAAARDLLLPNFFKNAVVSGKKIRIELNSNYAFYANLTALVPRHKI